MATTTIILALTEKAASASAYPNAAANIVQTYQSNENGFFLYNRYMQLLASLVSISNVMVAPVGFLNVTTNTMAGATTFLKIVADVKGARGIQPGDLISLVGNVSGIVSTFTIMSVGTLTPAGAVFAGVGVVANAAGVYDWGILQATFKKLANPIYENYFKNTPSASYTDRVVAPDLSLATGTEIYDVYDNHISSCYVNESISELTCSTVTVEAAREYGRAYYGDDYFTDDGDGYTCSSGGDSYH